MFASADMMTKKMSAEQIQKRLGKIETEKQFHKERLADPAQETRKNFSPSFGPDRSSGTLLLALACDRLSGLGEVILSANHLRAARTSRAGPAMNLRKRAQRCPCRGIELALTIQNRTVKRSAHFSNIAICDHRLTNHPKST
jgi:hypothetical protein